jgi:LacI family transcriptional regulator
MAKRRTTLSEVAVAAGVSVATVSKVLNERPDVAPETRRRVQKHLREAAYRPSGSDLRRAQPSRLIEVVISSLQNPYGIAVLDGITSTASVEGFEVVIGRPREADLADLNTRALLGGARAGAIFLTVDPAWEPLKVLTDRGLPAVVVDPLRLGTTRSITIGATNFTGGVAATEHLLSLGHRSIAHAGGPESTECSHARLAGYSSALRQAGIGFEESLVTHCAFTYDAGRGAAHYLLDCDNPPTAIFAASDELALGIMEEARRRGLRVPEDLSVVGFDDTFVASRSTPPLTTVAQPLVEMGRVAVRLLAQVIRNDLVSTRHIELATRLVVRDSTAPPGGNDLPRL